MSSLPRRGTFFVQCCPFISISFIFEPKFMRREIARKAQVQRKEAP